jgi:tRNA/rRNA methyltransferase/tRNA (cytidine32/uridine32-2'-O)-methyltransferase
MSSHINIILVNTSHPGNIGSTARAMKTMGLHDLTLVGPKSFPSDIATAKAVGCVDVLENAKVESSLADALCDSNLVVGFSARSRKSNIPSLSMNQLMTLLNNRKQDKVSIVFGNEQSGLSNDELQLCNYLVSIPTDKSYGSLNLASAVQIFSYEYFKSYNDDSAHISHSKLSNHSSKLVLIKKFLSIMQDLKIITQKNKNSLTQNIHIIFNKTDLTENEVNLYLGILVKIQKALKK